MSPVIFVTCSEKKATLLKPFVLIDFSERIRLNIRTVLH